MNLDDLGRMMDASTKSIFRLETLQQYLVAEGDSDKRFAAWQAGERLPRRTPDQVPWMADMQRRVAQGWRRYRVHIVDHPLSEYMRFELLCYMDNQSAGEELHIAIRNEHAELAGVQEDFWLIDDEAAVRMVYDDKGHFLCVEPTAEVGAYLDLRDLAMRCAEPLDRYLARMNPKLTV